MTTQSNKNFNSLNTNKSNTYFFTSESVSEGHPDKLADQISDSILDAIFTQDSSSRVAAETLCSNNLIVLAGEITTNAEIDYQSVVRNTIKNIGYTDKAFGLDYKDCEILVKYNKQSPDIKRGVDNASDDNLEIGAGDQGLMFGYACSETPEFMPQAITLAHQLVKKQSQVRKSGQLSWLRPDAKSQVTLVYQNGIPVGIDTIVLSTQHSPDISQEAIKEAVIEEIIKPVLPSDLNIEGIKYLINPTGRFVVGGPEGDAGLTGRKIIVDTYGGSAPHGGGAFCFAKGTKIKVVDGHKNIEDIKVGDLVWTKNENNNYLKLKPVKEVFTKTKENSYNLLEIELDSGEKIKVTEQHEIYTQRGWIHARDLTIEDEIFEFKDGKIPFSNNTLEYWITREFSIENAYKKIKEVQTERSPLSIQYWINKGYLKEEAKSLIKKEQRKRSPVSIDYYLKKGIAKEEAIKIISEYQGKTRENWTDEQWTKYKLTNGPSLEANIFRTGDFLGRIKYNRRNIKLKKSLKNFYEKLTKEEVTKRQARKGRQNGMFNITPKHNSGSGISGYYKNNLFRSLLELEAMLRLENKNIKFKANEKKGESIPELKIKYNYEGETYYYVPDILILDEREQVIKILEIKPIEYKELFIEEVLKYVSKNIIDSGLEFEIICSDVLNYNYKTYQKLYDNKIIEIHETKLNRFKGL